MYLRLEICVVCREFLASKYVYIIFFGTNQMINYICTLEILKTGFSVLNINLNLCGLSLTKVNGRAFKFRFEYFIVTKIFKFLILLRQKKTVNLSSME